MNSSDFTYILPENLIAQEALADRGAARMMVVNRTEKSITHSFVRDLPRFLGAEDVLVLNNTKVFPARLHGIKTDSGGKVELLLIKDQGEGRWEALLKSSRRPALGSSLTLGKNGQIEAVFEENGENGGCFVRFPGDFDLFVFLEKEGEAPLPPYIKRENVDEATREQDVEEYQTVYARETGAVAAPTAGLHFTNELLAELAAGGTQRTELTLHVGPGTFRPVSVERVEDHPMHSEDYVVSSEAAEAIQNARDTGKRLVAIGTTVVRTLETMARDHDGRAEGCAGSSDIFIYPPYDFKLTDALLTNFHLPQSTLLMLLCAFGGKDFILKAYQEAIEKGYRFYSYGDCMLVI